MTCREKMAKEHPKNVGFNWAGGCKGCPDDYGYLPKPEYCICIDDFRCTKCWDREIPETEEIRSDIPWSKIREVINDGAFSLIFIRMALSMSEYILGRMQKSCGTSIRRGRSRQMISV